MNSTEKIYDNFAEELRGFIRNKVDNKLTADDILQDVFIKIHSSIDTLKEETKLRGWLYQITRNTIIDYYRKEKPSTDEFPDLSFFEDIEEETPQEKLANSILEMIEDLPIKYSEALCLNECHGLSQKETAEKLNISYSGTKSRIQRGREMLRDSLMKCCHYEFDKYGTLIDCHPVKCCCCEQHSEKT